MKKHLKQAPVLAVVIFLAALALLPYTWAHFRATDGPAVGLRFAPYAPRPQAVKTGSSEIEVLLNNWEYTQTSPVGGILGGGFRPVR
jgi:hypothetical protein